MKYGQSSRSFYKECISLELSVVFHSLQIEIEIEIEIRMVNYSFSYNMY